jgi:hypothetical protein
MDKLREDNAAQGKYIIWRKPYQHKSVQSLVCGFIAHIGGPIIDEWGRKPAWIIWDDCKYVLEYDATDVPEKLNMMASKHSLEVMCAIEVYVFDSEQERLIGLLKLNEQYGS